MSVKHLNQIDLARRWSISPRTLQRLLWLGQGPRYIKIGGRVVYRVEEVEAFEAQQTRYRVEEVEAFEAQQTRANPAKAGRLAVAIDDGGLVGGTPADKGRVAAMVEANEKARKQREPRNA